MPPLRDSLMDYVLLCFVTTALAAMVTGGGTGLLMGLAELFLRPWSEVPSGLVLPVAFATFGALLGLVAAAITFLPAVLTGWLAWHPLRHHRVRLPATVTLWTLAAALTAAGLLPIAIPFILIGGLAALPIARRTHHKMMQFTTAQATP